MKFNFLVILLSFLMVGSVAAQDDYKASQEGWLIDIDEAYKQSKESGKPILANFTGSDWCGWCIRLKKAVFVKDEFKTWADENVVLLELDYPKRTKVPEEIKKQNAYLQQAFKIRGFPTIWIFELEKGKNDQFEINALGRGGYTPTVEQFITDMNKVLANKAKS